MQRAGRTGTGLALLIGLTGAGCGESGPAVVARVAERPIDEESLRRFVMALPPGLRTSKQGPEARRDYLQTLIDRELMLLEAEARGLREDAQLQRRLRRKVEERILSLYRGREIPAVEVTADEVETRVRELGLDRERLAEEVRVPSEEEALRLRAGLSGGQRFEDLAAGLPGARGGVLGWLNRLTAPRAGIPPAVFDTLAAGEVSAPLTLEGAWRMVRFVDERTSTDPSMRDRVRQRLLREARQEIEDQKVEVLARELHWAPDAGGLAFLAGLDIGNRRIPDLTPAEARTPLFTFEGGGPDGGGLPRCDSRAQGAHPPGPEGQRLCRGPRAAPPPGPRPAADRRRPPRSRRGAGDRPVAGPGAAGTASPGPALADRRRRRLHGHW